MATMCSPARRFVWAAAVITSNVIDTHSDSNLFATADKHTQDTATQTSSSPTVSISDVLGGSGAVINLEVAKDGSGATVTLSVDANASDSHAPAQASFTVSTSSTDVAGILKDLLDVPSTQTGHLG